MNRYLLLTKLRATSPWGSSGIYKTREDAEKHAEALGYVPNHEDVDVYQSVYEIRNMS